MFIIEDELHSEWQKPEYSTIAEAIAELKRRAVLPWDKPPNLAPCANWQTCGRNYEVIEFDTSITPWQELQRISVLEISAAGVKWFINEDS